MDLLFFGLNAFARHHGHHGWWVMTQVTGQRRADARSVPSSEMPDCGLFLVTSGRCFLRWDGSSDFVFSSLL